MQVVGDRADQVVDGRVEAEGEGGGEGGEPVGGVGPDGGRQAAVQGQVGQAVDGGPDDPGEVGGRLGRSPAFLLCRGDQVGARATWQQGAAANRFAPWAKRCRDLLESTARGEEVPRSSLS